MFVLLRSFLILIILAMVSPLCADSLEFEITGISPEIAENVKAHVGSSWVSGTQMSSQRRRNRFAANAEAKVLAALRPFGYYFPNIDSHMSARSDGDWVFSIDIRPGEPMTITNLDLSITGEGAEFVELAGWRANWSLNPGDRLNQAEWERQKESALDVAEEWGFLDARFTRHRIAIDLETNTAELELELETGPRWVLGEVHFQQELVQEHVLAQVPRFSAGDPYRTWYLDKLRTDLWKTGYFSDVEVVEQRRGESNPPAVDIRVSADERHRNTHQGTIGYGTDSDFRAQYSFTRHRLSDRGDSFTVGIGFQERDQEWRISGEYRLPRNTLSRQYWLANPTYRSEKQTLYVDADDDGELETELPSTRVNDLNLRLGRTRLRSIGWSQELLAETFFVDFLSENDDLAELDPQLLESLLETGLDFNDSKINTSTQNMALGLEYDWPVILGSGFHTTGHYERVWLVHSNEAWGSDVKFTQLYLSTRWSFLLGDDWLFLVRGEAGYTEAPVREFEFEIGDVTEIISVTQLPNAYRFKAGGSRSVRGYDFEVLTDNGLGSNNIFTASAEVEYNFHGDWSAAAFYDVGNAFNDWSDPDLKRGWGIGLRWYTLAGSIRLDVAQALDYDDKPWTIHFTIGTPLL